MAKKNDTIYVNDIERAIEFVSEQDNTKIIKCKISDTESFDIKVKKYIDIKEYQQMNIDIVHMVFGSGNNVYCPALYDFAIDYWILHNFTNLKIENANKLYKWILTHGDIMRQIYDYICVRYSDIRRDSDNLIQYRLSQMPTYSKWDNLADIIYPLIENLSGLKETIGEINPENWKDILSAAKTLSNFETKDFNQIVANTIKNNETNT